MSTRMDLSLERQTVLVTGASSGIGRAVCETLSAHGASVALLGRDRQRLEDVMETLPSERCLALPADLADLEGIHAHMEQAWSWHGRIDGCVHCAGAGERARLRDTTPDLLSRQMRLHCFAFIEMTRCLTKLKKKGQSLRMVGISSLACLGRDKYHTAYAASKAALETAAKSMATELLRKDITVNCIRPAFVNTPSITAEDALGGISLRLEESRYQPLGLIEPEEVARMSAFLLSEAARRITGSVFTINAGVPC